MKTYEQVRDALGEPAALAERLMNDGGTGAAHVALYLAEAVVWLTWRAAEGNAAVYTGRLALVMQMLEAATPWRPHAVAAAPSRFSARSATKICDVPECVRREGHEDAHRDAQAVWFHVVDGERVTVGREWNPPPKKHGGGS